MNKEFLELYELLKEKKITLCAAESCTGGLFSKLLTDIPGSSEIFMGGVVCYSNSCKEKLLRVHNETLKTYGAVSEQTARELIDGLKFHFETDLYVGITGIAGPSGGTEEKPVGTVFVSYCFREEIWVINYSLSGDREFIREQVCELISKEIKKIFKES